MQNTIQPVGVCKALQLDYYLYRICEAFEKSLVVPLTEYRGTDLSCALASLWEILKKNHRAYMTQCDQMPEIFCSFFFP